MNDFDYQPPSLAVDALRRSIAYKLAFSIGRDPVSANSLEWLEATLLATRDRMVERWLRSNRAESNLETRQVYYLSMEFLIGRTLINALVSLGLYDEVKEALAGLNLDIDKLAEEEPDPGLGNGGLGRLAACFLDSMATLSLPARGYGIRYEYGMFRQRIVDGQQAEVPDNWLEYGNSWEFPRDNVRFKVRFGGRLQFEGARARWMEDEVIIARAFDQVIPGYDTSATNTLRLWSARASNEINLGKFNQGDYFAAVADKNQSENVSRVLYPDDTTSSGRELRLRQEYFLVSATMQDILQRHFLYHQRYDNLADKIAIHLNDTHPVLAIPELMRLLIDEHGFAWNDAWAATERIFSYTNHTLMNEALETWPVDMLGRILPRHLQLIFEINEHFLEQVRAQVPGDDGFASRVSLIDEGNGRRVRMAWLAVVASQKVNGVSELHSKLMVESLFADFAKLFPTRFVNVTNGVTPRRWLDCANPGLSRLVDSRIGKRWRLDLELLVGLEPAVEVHDFIDHLREIKRTNKQRLADYVKSELGIEIDPDSMFDVQVKRIHEYKRQLLNLLHVLARYNRILDDPDGDWVPRTVIFAGKAASAYHAAKQVIRLINDVATVINADPRANKLLKVVFIPNYGVSLAQLLIPAADLSEQISLAGTEASGTGNMKFALNGALTIGTLDGANVEMRERIGEENMFIFGNTAEQVEELRRNGYNPRDYYVKDPELFRLLNQVIGGTFSPTEPGRYRDCFDLNDNYQLLADFRSYVETQEQVDVLYRDPAAWARKAALNIARIGYFSSDRAVAEYAERIWQVEPLRL
ncbi:glycogen/starch/alpha-glucan family phosphorylase [Halotalea alkalilenta]|uniref:Alpha-1,4 glucan phosphorylase n=1 Tax=Halotalea alkalilenta TaxID=376489 RepID=A0A172YJ42_9GAMM|nr:glycogen/starch/alpha-glucan family phosphorylase [Halotalea alkalilenta]ANF59214.1 glycogen phosphorylase [Halotalea alkalilenta]